MVRIYNTQVIDIVAMAGMMLIPIAIMVSWAEITECSKKLDELISGEAIKECSKKFDALINDEEE